MLTPLARPKSRSNVNLTSIVIGNEPAPLACGPVAIPLCPPKLPQGDPVVPDLGHVADLVAVKVHDVDVVGLSALAGRRYRPALPGVCSAEDAERRHVVPRLVDGERTQLGVAVRQWCKHALHPLGVSLHGVHTVQGGGLGGERRAAVAVLLAPLPSLPGLACIEESFGGVSDGGHRECSLS